MKVQKNQRIIFSKIANKNNEGVYTSMGSTKIGDFGQFGKFYDKMWRFDFFIAGQKSSRSEQRAKSDMKVYRTTKNSENCSLRSTSKGSSGSKKLVRKQTRKLSPKLKLEIVTSEGNSSKLMLRSDLNSSRNKKPKVKQKKAAKLLLKPDVSLDASYIIKKVSRKPHGLA